jgi:hypothetical protein
MGHGKEGGELRAEGEGTRHTADCIRSDGGERGRGGRSSEAAVGGEKVEGGKVGRWEGGRQEQRSCGKKVGRWESGKMAVPRYEGGKVGSGQFSVGQI